MKVAILYICTGKYNQFFSGFYESCEKYFLKDIASVDYFVFTDEISLSTASNVHLIERQCQGFPLDSLFRFDMFLQVEKELVKFDYLFFFNSNMLFVAPVGREILPEKEGLCAVLHPGYYRKPNFLYPYERNKKSTAYIDPPKLFQHKKYSYYMGSLNGGKTEAYLEFIRTCSENTHKDYNQGLVAMVHDESHLNKYLSERKCLALSPAFAFPEGWHLPFSPKLLIRNKVRIDPYFDKGRDHSLKGKIKKGIGIFKRAISWYL